MKCTIKVAKSITVDSHDDSIHTKNGPPLESESPLLENITSLYSISQPPFCGSL